ncbi:uncharacterized protein [Argopecten irradians]|uniref:uncharacterized protein n=1 Tax=Argopecten irradians TaxID=31199 RepID=UPI003714A50E
MKRASCFTLENLAVGELWILFLMLLLPVTEGKKTKLVGMDKKKVCRDQNSVMVDYLREKESALILAKTVDYKDASDSRDCNVILAPDSDSSKQFLLLEFESFHMPDCDVELIIHQCPFVTFDRDIILMRRLGCKDRNPRSLMTKRNHNVRFILHREYVTPKRVYNFRINVTLTDGKKTHQDTMSMGLKIGIVGVSVIAAIIVAIMVFKAVRLKMIVRQEYIQEETQESHHVLTSLSNSRQRLQPNSYTELTDHPPLDNHYINADPLNQHTADVQVTETRNRDNIRQTSSAVTSGNNNQSSSVVTSGNNSHSHVPSAVTSGNNSHSHVCSAVTSSNNSQVTPDVVMENNRQIPLVTPSSTHTYANTQQVKPTGVGTKPTPATSQGRKLPDFPREGTRPDPAPPQGQKLPEPLGEGASLTPTQPMEGELPENPPSYEEAIDMPIPITATVTGGSTSPLYQNLNTADS